MKKEIVKNCFDILAGFEIQTNEAKKQALFSVVDTLGSYPKPQRKGVNVVASNKCLGAYLFVSNSRNACKLGANGFIDTFKAYQLVSENLENALSLLLD